MIILITVAAYFLVGLVGARVARNSVLNDYYQDELKKFDRQIARHHDKQTVENLKNNKHSHSLENALESSEYKTTASFAVVFTFFLWPIVGTVFGLIKLKNLIIKSTSFSFMKSKSEKEVSKIVKDREYQAFVQKRQEEFIKQAEDMGIDTTILEELKGKGKLVV